MAGLPITQMVVIDFSGTLSLEAVLFAAHDNLLRELKASGLWQLPLAISLGHLISI